MSTEITVLNAFNWEEAATLEVPHNQNDFIPSNLFSIAQSKFDNNCVPLGIEHNGQMAGFAMYAHHKGIYWITRIMVGEEFQQQGIGSTALRKLVDLLRRKSDCKEIRTTVSRKNTWGQYLFASGGFEPMGEDEKEVIMRFTRS